MSLINDRAQARGPNLFMVLLVITLIVAILIIDIATDIGQSTDLNARLAGASLALIFTSAPQAVAMTDCLPVRARTVGMAPFQEHPKKLGVGES